MSTDNVQIVLTAKDQASAQVNKVSNALLGVTKNARLLRRETFGVQRFAAALDVVAGTRFGGLITSLNTIGYALAPFQDQIEQFIGTLGGKIEQAGATLAARIGALSIPLAEEGTTVGTAIGTAMNNGIIAGLTGAGLALAVQKALTDSGIGKGALPGGLDLFPDWNRNIAAHNQAIADAAAKAAAATAPVYSSAFAEEFAKSNPLQAAIDRSMEVAPTNRMPIVNAATGFVTGFTQAVAASAPQVFHQTAYGFVDQYSRAISDEVRRNDALARDAQQFADTFTTNLADDLRKNKKVVQGAMKDINWALAHPEALQRQLGRIQSVLNSSKLATLLSSDNPELRAIGEQVRARLTGQFDMLTGTTYQQGVTSIVGAINSLRGYLHINVNVPSATSAPPYQPGPTTPPQPGGGGFASGGYIRPGHWSWTGERGPERVYGGRTGVTVVPKSEGHGHAIVMDGRIVGRLIDERLGRSMSLMPAGVVNRG